MVRHGGNGKAELFPHAVESHEEDAGDISIYIASFKRFANIFFCPVEYLTRINKVLQRYSRF